MEYDAYDDGLQSWLAGNPAWPGWPSQPENASLEVAVLRGESRLHQIARELAAEASRRAAAGDARAARRADDLLAAVLQELSA
jgi:hypothetical protein